MQRSLDGTIDVDVAGKPQSNAPGVPRPPEASKHDCVYIRPTGTDPNKLVKVTDRVSDSSLPSGGYLGHFFTLRSAEAGEVLRGVALAPGDDDGDSIGW
jgi:hypothetical protein